MNLIDFSGHAFATNKAESGWNHMIISETVAGCVPSPSSSRAGGGFNCFYISCLIIRHKLHISVDRLIYSMSRPATGNEESPGKALAFIFRTAGRRHEEQGWDRLGQLLHSGPVIISTALCSCHTPKYVL